jgi:hypothetical protein
VASAPWNETPMTEQPKPSEYYCGHCGRNLEWFSGAAIGNFMVHADSRKVACQWPGLGWSLHGNNAKPVKRT